VQIDRDPRNIGLRYPTSVNLIGDAADTLQALLPYLHEKEDTSWREAIQKNKEQWRAIEEDRAHQSATPINPQLLYWVLNQKLPSDAILTGDAGTPTNWLARHVTVRGSMKISLSGNLATMGSAVPYAIAAKFAFPDRCVI